MSKLLTCWRIARRALAIGVTGFSVFTLTALYAYQWIGDMEWAVILGGLATGWVISEAGSAVVALCEDAPNSHSR